MTTVILVLATLALAALLVSQLRTLLVSDGLGHRPVPRSHRDEQTRELAAWPH